jgi:hypothetical protein
LSPFHLAEGVDPSFFIGAPLPGFADAIVDAVCKAWRRVTSEGARIKSLCSIEWATTVEN